MKRFRDDRGALMNALLFVAVALVVVGGMTGWLLTRMQTDARTLADAQLTSAINVYSEVITAQSNQSGIAAVKAGTVQAYPDLAASVTITSWTPNASGDIVAVLTATSTKGLPRTKVAKVTLRTAQVGAYLGLDGYGRPMWTQSGPSYDPLALRVLSQ